LDFDALGAGDGMTEEQKTKLLQSFKDWPEGDDEVEEEEEEEEVKQKREKKPRDRNAQYRRMLEEEERH
jgi:hypothetical protein